jgi:hypothetical protein
MRCKVLTAVNLTILLSDVTECSLVYDYQRFGGLAASILRQEIVLQPLERGYNVSYNNILKDNQIFIYICFNINTSIYIRIDPFPFIYHQDDQGTQ